MPNTIELPAYIETFSPSGESVSFVSIKKVTGAELRAAVQHTQDRGCFEDYKKILGWFRAARGKDTDLVAEVLHFNP